MSQFTPYLCLTANIYYYCTVTSVYRDVSNSNTYSETLTFWRLNYFFLILAHPVYKMWIMQEPNMLELWNKLHFEEKKTECIYHV